MLKHYGISLEQRRLPGDARGKYGTSEREGSISLSPTGQPLLDTSNCIHKLIISGPQ